MFAKVNVTREPVVFLGKRDRTYASNGTYASHGPISPSLIWIIFRFAAYFRPR
jgi:hypothetical protein